MRRCWRGFEARTDRKKAALFEKSAQKLLRAEAFERPQFGRSKAVGIESFLVAFFQKKYLRPFP
jgi:hypothetical protein